MSMPSGAASSSDQEKSLPSASSASDLAPIAGGP